jgi:hypothetical protein
MTREQRREAVRASAAARGLTITHTGRVYRIIGRGVDIACIDLAIIKPGELNPPMVGQFGRNRES